MDVTHEIKSRSQTIWPVWFQRGNKSSKVIDRLRKKLTEQESLLLLTSPSLPIRVYNKSGKVATLIPVVKANLKTINTLSPHIYHYSNNSHMCVCVQGYSFLISSDYERAEWRELMKEQQKKCKCCVKRPGRRCLLVCYKRRSRNFTRDAAAKCGYIHRSNLEKEVERLIHDVIDSLCLFFLPSRFENVLLDVCGAANVDQLLRQAADCPPHST